VLSSVYGNFDITASEGAGMAVALWWGEAPEGPRSLPRLNVFPRRRGNTGPTIVPSRSLDAPPLPAWATIDRGSAAHRYSNPLGFRTPALSAKTNRLFGSLAPPELLLSAMPALTAMSALSLLLRPRDATLGGITCLRR
jgi:hypothetical protein